MSERTDGFDIARRELEIRGSGKGSSTDATQGCFPAIEADFARRLGGREEHLKV